MNSQPSSVLPSSPFIVPETSVGKVMRTVIFALMPGVVLYIVLFGWGVLVNIVLAAASALFFEYLMLLLRGRPVRVFLSDGSALVSAILLALALPPLVPWWLPVTGSFFAIVAAKHLYGGLGYNAFNPAMLAYAILLIAFPRQLSAWTGPLDLTADSLSLAQALAFSLFSDLPEAVTFDALSMATPLDYLRTQTGLGQPVVEIVRSPVFGTFAGHGMEWVNSAFLLGGVWLIYRRIISWHIPVAMLGALAAMATITYGLDPVSYANPALHLWAGAGILGAFFIATDPVTAATTPLGRLIYGAGIGVLSFSIRVWGGYPDGVAFAVLLMGLTVPLLDHYALPRMFGAGNRHG